MENLHERVATLEVRFEEKWKAHEEAQKELLTRIECKLEELLKRLDKVSVLENKVENIQKQLSAMWVTIGTVIIGGIILGIWMKVLFPHL